MLNSTPFFGCYIEHEFTFPLGNVCVCAVYVPLEQAVKAGYSPPLEATAMQGSGLLLSPH